MVVYDCRGVVLAGVLLGTVGVKLPELIALAIKEGSRQSSGCGA